MAISSNPGPICTRTIAGAQSTSKGQVSGTLSGACTQSSLEAAAMLWKQRQLENVRKVKSTHQESKLEAYEDAVTSCS
jgi:hypothetical protein